VDRKLFPHKYQTKGKYDHTSADEKTSLWDVVTNYAWQVLIWLSLAAYVVVLLDGLFGIIGDINLLEYLFGDTAWVVHFIFCSTIAYKVYDFVTNRNKA